MKIVYIEKFTLAHHEQGKVKAFQRLGHEVIPIEESTLVNIDQVLRYKPDLVLFTKLKIDEGIRTYFCEKMRREGIKTACWMPDLYFGMPRECKVKARDEMFKADYVFSPDGGNQDKFKEYKVNHILLRQSIDPESCYLGKVKDYKELAFVGTWNPLFQYRNEMIKFMRRTYPETFTFYGRNNENDIRGDRLNDLYNSAKVIIGDSVYSPRYWSNRIYETIGRAGFIIHPMTEGLDEEFIPYKHFIPYYYGDWDGLKEKIDYYLKHDEERDKIRFAGFEHCKKYHTLNNRCADFIKHVSTN